MTRAPDALMKARQWIIDHWGVDPNGMGIVGDPRHQGGYHCGSDRVVNNDYSVVESQRDLRGLSDYASAMDIGLYRHDGETPWKVARKGLRDFSKWLVAECAKNTADTRNIREVIYTPDGRTVKRWDRLKRRTTGDISHITHTHISIHRDASNATIIALFQRWTKEVLGMDYTDDRVKNPRQRGDSDTNPTVQLGFYFDDSYQKTYDLRDDVKAVNVKVDTLTEMVRELKQPVYVQLTDAQFAEYLDRVDNGE